MRLYFRPAQTADLPLIEALVNSAYRGESSKQGWTTEADLLGGQRVDTARLGEMLEPDLKGQIQRLELGFSALDTQKPVACFYLRHEPKTAYVGLLTVDPLLQGGGYGKQLLDRAEEIGHEWKCNRMRMTVIHLRDELLAYYERRGYVRTGNSEPFPTDDPRFGIPKVEGMRLLELVKQI